MDEEEFTVSASAKARKEDLQRYAHAGVEYGLNVGPSTGKRNRLWNQSTSRDLHQNKHCHRPFPKPLVTFNGACQSKFAGVVGWTTTPCQSYLSPDSAISIMPAARST